MTAFPRVILLFAALLSMPGCATVALNAALRAAHPQPPWNGEVAVATEPPGGRCTVARGAQVMAEVEAAPGTVRLSGPTTRSRCAAPPMASSRPPRCCARATIRRCSAWRRTA